MRGARGHGHYVDSSHKYTRTSSQIQNTEIQNIQIHRSPRCPRSRHNGDSSHKYTQNQRQCTMRLSPLKNCIKECVHNTHTQNIPSEMEVAPRYTLLTLLTLLTLFTPLTLLTCCTLLTLLTLFILFKLLYTS